MPEAIHPYLQRALLVFVATLLFVAGLASAAYVYMDAAQEKQHAAQRALKIWKNRVDKSRQDNSIIDAYESTYLKLVDRAVIGEEDRLSWYQAIQAISESRGMPSVKYSVSSQLRHHPAELARQFKGLELYRSTMTMDIRMAHEGDLFALLNALQHNAKGLFVVDKCNIENLGSDETGTARERLNTMKAYCELSWYTLRADKAGGGKA